MRFAVPDWTNPVYSKQWFGQNYLSAGPNRYRVRAGNILMPTGYESSSYSFPNEVIQPTQLFSYHPTAYDWPPAASSANNYAFALPGFALLQVTVTSGGKGAGPGLAVYLGAQRQFDISGANDVPEWWSQYTDGQSIARFAVPDWTNTAYSKYWFGMCCSSAGPNRYRVRAPNITMPFGFESSSYSFANEVLQSGTQLYTYHPTAFGWPPSTGSANNIELTLPRFAAVELATGFAAGTPVYMGAYRRFPSGNVDVPEWWSQYADSGGIVRFAMPDWSLTNVVYYWMGWGYTSRGPNDVRWRNVNSGATKEGNLTTYLKPYADLLSSTPPRISW